MHHHYRCLGGWTFAFGDYWAENLTSYLDSPAMSQSLTFLDPYSELNYLRIWHNFISKTEYRPSESNKDIIKQVKHKNTKLVLCRSNSLTINES